MEGAPPLLQVLVATPAVAGGVMGALTTADATVLRAVDPRLTAAVAAVPWHAGTTRVHRLAEWAACFPVAYGAALGRGAVEEVARCLGALQQEGGAAAVVASLRELCMQDVNVRSFRDAFRHLRGLEALDVAGCRICDEDVAALPRGLRRLRIARATATAPLVSVRLLASLVELDAMGCKAVTDAVVAALPPSCQRLCITGCSVTAGATYGHLPLLAALEAGRTGLDIPGLLSLPPTLAHLDASDCRAVSEITSFERFTHLIGVNISTTHAGDRTLASLPPTVQHLHLVRCDITAAVSCSRMRALVLVVADFTDFSDGAVTALPPCLRVLRLSNCSKVTARVSFAHLPALQSLVCDSTGIGDAAIATLAPSLYHLNITWCWRVTAAVSAAHLPNLRSLVCRHTKVAALMVGSLPPCLGELDIATCTSLPCDVSVRHLPMLTSLLAPGSSLGDAAIAALPPAVETLNIEACHAVTPAVTFRHLPSLISLHVCDTAVNLAAVASLPPSLQYLAIGVCHGATGWTSFAHLPALTTLRCPAHALTADATRTMPPSVATLDYYTNI